MNDLLLNDQNESKQKRRSTRMENQSTDTTYCFTRIRGRANVEVNWQHGVLYVQLIRVAELVTHSSDQPYEIRAKIAIEHSLACNSEQWCNCQMETVKCSRFPVFNSKVSFEVHDLDCDMKLVVVILICDSTTGRQTIIGSVSFSIRSIVIENKPISGWYHLFKEEEDLNRMKREMSTSEILKWELYTPSDNQLWLDPKCYVSRVFLMQQHEVLSKVQFHLCRPPTVSEVDEASLFHTGDVILSLNDIDVSSYRGSNIHRIIRSINVALYKVEVLRKVPNYSTKYEFCHDDKQRKVEVCTKKEHNEYDVCHIDKQGIGEVSRKETGTAEMKETEIYHKEIIRCVVGDADETENARCAFVSRGSRPRPSLLKNITKCMGDTVTVNSCAEEQIYYNQR